MNIIPTEIDGVLIIEPRIFQDSRGYFFESFNLSRCASSSIEDLEGTQQSGLPIELSIASLAHDGCTSRGTDTRRQNWSGS